MNSPIVTGFGPFGEVEYNPSWDCAQACAEALESAAILLPVTFEGAASFAEGVRGVDELVIHFGVAVARDAVSLERYAHNWGRDVGDARPVRLVEGGEVACESALPLDAWAEELNGAAGRIWTVSHCAGTYVCNATYYHTLTALPSRTAVFVHVPQVQADEAREIGARLARVVRRHAHSCRDFS